MLKRGLSPYFYLVFIALFFISMASLTFIVFKEEYSNVENQTVIMDLSSLESFCSQSDVRPLRCSYTDTEVHVLVAGDFAEVDSVHFRFPLDKEFSEPVQFSPLGRFAASLPLLGRLQLSPSESQFTFSRGVLSDLSSVEVSAVSSELGRCSPSTIVVSCTPLSGTSSGGSGGSSGGSGGSGGSSGGGSGGSGGSSGGGSLGSQESDCFVGYCLPRDALGWTFLNLSSDARVIYVSNSTGNDSWDGFTPEWNGTSGPKKTIEAGYSLLRAGYPDWLLLKRGDRWNSALGGSGGWRRWGRSPTEPMIISTYGSSSSRPIITGGVYMGGGGGDPLPPNNHFHSLIFDGIHFYNPLRDPLSNEFNGSLHTPSNFYVLLNASHILIEDCYFQGSSVVFQAPRAPNFAGQVNLTLRRSLVTDVYSIAGHTSGFYGEGVNGLLIEENLFDHNGWSEDFGYHQWQVDPGNANPLVWELIVDGRFGMKINGTYYNFSNIDFSGVFSMEEVAERIESAINYEVASRLGQDAVNVTWFKAVFLFTLNNVTNPYVHFTNLSSYLGDTPGTDLHTSQWLNGPGGVPQATIFNHNIYLQTKDESGEHPQLSTDHRVVRNIILRGSSHGLQARSGGMIEDNFFYDNPIAFFLGGHNIRDMNTIPGLIEDNVVLKGGDIQEIDAYQPRGWGWSIETARDILARGNIVAHVGVNHTNSRGIELVMNRSVGPGFNIYLTNISLSNNIIYNWAGLAVTGLPNVTPAGIVIVNTTIHSFGHLNRSIISHGLFDVSPADFSYSTNAYYADRDSSLWFFVSGVYMNYTNWSLRSNDDASSVTPFSFLDPDRSVVSYQTYVGREASYDAFISGLRNQSRSNWASDYTAELINEYFRAGFVRV